VTGITFEVVNDELLSLRLIVILHLVINETVLLRQAQQHKHIDASKSHELQPFDDVDRERERGLTV
jgi:hypothetical protein